MKKLFICLVLALFTLAGAAAPKRVSEISWIWAGTPKNVPIHAYLRTKIMVKEPVKRAYFYAFWDKRGSFYINGTRVTPQPWKPVWNLRGHVKGSGVDFTKLLKKGENVLAIHLDKNKLGCYGIMLRGLVEFASGKKIHIISTGRHFKTSPKAAPNWNKPGFNDSKWTPAVELGDVTITPWSNYGNVAAAYCSPEELAAIKKFCLKGFPLKKLQSEPAQPKISIVYRGNMSGIKVNNKVIPFVQMPGSSQALDRPRDELIIKGRKAGIPMLRFSVNSDRFQILDGSGRYDLSELDLAVRRMLSLHPDAYINLYFKGNPMKWWIAKNPDELVKYAFQVPPKRRWHHYYNNEVAVSFASQKFLEEIGRDMKNIADFCLKQPWGRRIIMISTGFGTSGDGMPPGAHAMPDTGKRMTEKFRAYLKAKYKTDAALQKSWNDRKVTLKTARVPDAVERYGSGMYLRDSKDPKDRRVIDYYICYHETFADYMIGFGKAVKKAFPGRLFSTFFGYMFLGYTPEGNTANFERAIASPYVDTMDGTTVGYNLSDGLYRTLPSTIRRYKKLTTVEGDIRTHLGLNSPDSEPQWTCNSPETTRATASRWIGNTLLNGAGCHIVDFGSNRRLADCPEMLEPIAAGIKVWKKIFNAGSLKENADIAVVLDPVQIWKQGFPSYFKNSPVVNNVMQFAVKTLNFSGFAHDLMGVDDFLLSKRNYKAVVFLNLFEMTPARRAALQKKLRKPGVTAIWNYAPGLIGPKGYSDQSMSALTGIRLSHTKKEFIFKSYRDGAAARNWVSNSGFEEGLKMWDMTHVDKTNKDKVAVSLVENKAFRGKRNIRIEVKQPLKKYSCLIRRFNAAKEKELPNQLTLAFRGKGSASAVVTWWNKKGRAAGYRSRHLAAKEKWQEISLDLSLPEDTARIFLEVRFSRKAALELDEVTLSRKAPALALWNYSAREVPFGPRVHSVDPAAEVLMRYKSDGKPSLVRKKLPGGSTAVFSGIPVNSPEVWAELLQAAGCHKYTAPGYFVRSCEGLLMVSSTRKGNISPGDNIVKSVINVPAAFQVALPGKYTSATDIFTGTKYTPVNGKLQLRNERPRVWFFELKK